MKATQGQLWNAGITPSVPLFANGPAAAGTEHLLAILRAVLADSAGLTAAEVQQLGEGHRADPAALREVTQAAASGADPLGDLLLSSRTPDMRRASGSTYTPSGLVAAMIASAASLIDPATIVDPGAGSGRFLVQAGTRFPKAHLIASEIDPLAAMVTRANLHLHGLTDRACIVLGDYRTADIPISRGPTLFIGNPPYVRHHALTPESKLWYTRTAAQFGQKASGLAGLHLHFFLRTLELAKEGDVGVFITAAEWLDVNYGRTLRRLLCDGLGGIAVDVLDPEVRAFADAMTTAVVTSFRVASEPRHIAMRRVMTVEELGRFAEATTVDVARARDDDRWGRLISGVPAPAGAGRVGDLFRVHRGQVTGNNSVWIPDSPGPGLPKSVLKPAVTRARELIDSGNVLETTAGLRCVVDLPATFDAFDEPDRLAIEEFLTDATSRGALDSYIARHRQPWWRVGLREPAPILCTYMGRRPPVFSYNAARAYHVNIAHGLYPRTPMSEATLRRIAEYLNTAVRREAGRTYAGGLTKFEPREIEAIELPPEIV